MKRKTISRSSPNGGFTILEILVATAILLLMFVVVFAALGQASGLWRRSMDKIESFQEARLAFDSLTRNLAQATLNTYLDYDDPNGPQRYLRKADLRFLIGESGAAGFPGTVGSGQTVFFQAPIGYATNTAYTGIDGLLDACGYFVGFSTNNRIPPHVAGANNPYRYRLYQILVPSEENQMNAAVTTSAWFASHTNLARPIADNVIALVLRPQDPGGSTNVPPNDAYVYDTLLNATSTPQPVTGNQLPPMVDVTLITLDETSAARIANGASAPSVIDSALSGRFSDPAVYEADLVAIKSALTAAHLNYRIFNSAVPIRESKWTK